MKKPIYICFEGLKGAGKSTIFELVLPVLKRYGYKVQGICPTKSTCHCPNKSACRCRSLERVFNKWPFLDRCRFLQQFLYAHRYSHVAESLDWDVDIFLGDRSLITSYACLWSDSKIRNYFWVLLTNQLETKIPVPDYVIYFDVPYEELQRRLEERGGCKNVDSSYERSIAMKRAYDIFRTQKGIIKRIENTKWYVVDAEKKREQVCREVLYIVKQIMSV